MNILKKKKKKFILFYFIFIEKNIKNKKLYDWTSNIIKI